MTRPIPPRAFGLLLVLLLVAPSTVAGQDPDNPGEGPTITLNGEQTRVRWSDGDSFRILEGEHADRGVRLGGYNTLESYGPVHRWGDWTAAELAEVSDRGTELARAGAWTCTTDGATDHYDRILVSCPDLTLAMLEAGLGHLFVMEGAALPASQAAQDRARAAALGMWEKGIPEALITSLHSTAEGRETTYNRVISTTDGQSTQIEHAEAYEVCQEVCMRGSCMVYVPYRQRYGDDRAPCLRDETAGQ